MLPRFVIAFLPRSRCLLISWLRSPAAVILEPKKIKSVTVSIVSPSICHEVMGPDAMIIIFECWILTQLFHSLLSHSSRGSLVPLYFLPLQWYHLHIWLIFLPAILIPACASSCPAFLMMSSAEKLNKQGDNIQPQCSPFPIWNQSAVPCPVLTVASWPAYRFLKRWVRWSGIPIPLRVFHSLWFIQPGILRDVLCI